MARTIDWSGRVDLYGVWPDGRRAMLELERTVRESGLEASLVELVRLRASQVNGCAYCLDMHAKDAMAAGETAQRLVALSAWRETPFFTDRERAALALTEAVTRISDPNVPDQVLDAAREQFEPAELAKLVFAIVAINAWNRLAITAQTPVGGYQPSP